MRVLLQRVQFAKVEVDQKVIGEIEGGLLAFLGVHQDDDESLIKVLVDKMVNLRIFEDENQKMNKSLMDVKQDVLIVSQFTLYANCFEGRRPSFIQSAKPDIAKGFYDQFISETKKMLAPHGQKVATGSFGADMKISLLNDGPVTIMLDKSLLST